MKYYFARWKTDVVETFLSSRRWDRDFDDSIGPRDVRYAAFLGALSLVPAILVLKFSDSEKVEAMRRFFAVPPQILVTGLLMSIFLWASTYLNRCPTSYPRAFKLTLRIMSVQPLLGFSGFSAWGPVAILIAYGVLVVRGAVRAFAIPFKSAALFFGTIYATFAVMQLQSILKSFGK